MNLTKRPAESGTLETLRREMDHFFDDLVPFSLNRENGGKTLATWAPSADITEDEKEYQLHLDIPGLEKKDIKVNYQDGRITITGERKMEEKVEKRDHIRRERYQGKFYRSFTLPEKINEESIQASFTNGVLKLVIPKAEVVKPKEIKVT